MGAPISNTSKNVGQKVLLIGPLYSGDFLRPPPLAVFLGKTLGEFLGDFLKDFLKDFLRKLVT